MIWKGGIIFKIFCLVKNEGRRRAVLEKKNGSIFGEVRFILIGEHFFQKFQSLEIIGDRYVSTYGGVLSLFVKFSLPKNIKYVNIPIFGKKNRSIRKIEKLREKNVEKLEKKSSPIRMTLSR